MLFYQKIWIKIVSVWRELILLSCDVLEREIQDECDWFDIEPDRTAKYTIICFDIVYRQMAPLSIQVLQTAYDYYGELNSSLHNPPQKYDFGF